jgi:hypothetical protein
MLNSAAKLKLGGGGVNSLNEATILYGKGQNIKDIDYDSITINKLVFDPPLIIEKIIPNDPDNPLSLPYNKISISNNAYYFKSETDLKFQKRLFAQSGIILNNDSNISVDFNQSGWINEISKLYTNINKIGIGTNNPLDSIHIKNNNAAIIIDNNINKFKLANTSGNYFSIGNNNGHNEIIENDNFFIEQLKIHRDAPHNAVVINNIGSVAINCNIIINKDTYLTSNIYINNSNIVDWLGINGLASYSYVNNLVDNMNPIDITNLDYNNIKKNRLNFVFPLTSNITNNEIGIDLINSIGFNKINSNIFTNNFKLGIGINEPLGLLHIGSTSFSLENSNANDGSLIISKSTPQNTRILKLGFDNNLNFIIGNLNNNNWTSSIIIQPSAPNNSLIINNSGNLTLNNSLNINSNLTLRGPINLNNFNISFTNNNFILGNSFLILNNNGNIGIGTNPDNLNQFIINGNIKTNNNIFGKDIIVNNGTFQNINLSNISVSSLIQSSNCIITSELITKSLNTLTSINTQNLISSNLINAKNISCSYLNLINSGTIDTGIINASSLISGSSLTILNDISSSSILSSSINSTNFITSNATIIKLTTTSIQNSGTIICNGDITCANITTIANIKAEGIIDTPSIIAITINGANLNITNLISSLHITSTNLTSSNISTNNLTVNTIINTPSIKSSTINATNINSTIINTTGNITSAGTVLSDIMNTNNIICLNKIALNISDPIAELHIGNSSSSTINPSFIITYNQNNFKMGYDNNNNFVFGSFNKQNSLWNNQMSINRNAPNNSININNIGNVGIGKTNSENLYKIDVNGNLNATQLFQNDEAVLTSNNITTLINTNLVPYITSNTVSSTYSTIKYVVNSIDQTTTYIEDTIYKALSQNNYIYTSQKRYPNNIINNSNNTINPSTYYSSIYGIKETIAENITINNNTTSITYEIYSSSSYGFNSKSRLFNYQNTSPRFLVSWGLNNYDAQKSVFISSAPSIDMKNSPFYNIGPTVPGFNKTYNGDFIIFKFNQPIILTKFIFYITTDNIQTAPGNWVCFATNDDKISINEWTYIQSASIDINIQLSKNKYIQFNEFLSYYQQTVNMEDNVFQYYAFVFNKLVLTIPNVLLNSIPGRTLQLTRIELFGKNKTLSFYTTSNLLFNTLDNYFKLNDDNNTISGNVDILGTVKSLNLFTSNLAIDTTISSSYKLNVNGSIYSSNNIICQGNIGIGTINSPLYKLTVNGSIYSSNSLISDGDIVEKGDKLSDKYLKITNASQYLISDDILNNSNLQKKIAFKFVCNIPIVINNETYYKYDINISTYAKNKYDNVDMSNYRIFNIKCFSSSGIFSSMISNIPPTILQYDVYMSSHPSLTVFAIGYPTNYYLNEITTDDICLLKTTDFNYISVISKTNDNNMSCIISDFLF